MLNKRQYGNLKRIKMMCDADGKLNSDSFVAFFGKDKGNYILDEIGKMGLVLAFFEGMKITLKGEAALEDYRNTRKDKWESRLFHFLSGLGVGIITGVAVTLIIQPIIS